MISYRSTMSLAMFITTLMITIAVIHGCIPTNTDSTLKPNSYDGDGGFLEVWQGSVDFINYWCGIPESSYHSDKPDDKRRRRRETLNDVDINKYSLDHSLVLFRGKCFEFGPGNDLLYVRGGVGRMAKGCPVTWTRIGESKCTMKEAEDMAAIHQAQHGYHLLWNNCHHFTEWLLHKLVTNQCSVANANGDDDIVKENKEGAYKGSLKGEEENVDFKGEVSDKDENKNK